MNIKNFVEQIAEAIKNRNENLEVIPTETQGTNGSVRHGLTLRKDDSRVTPIFYLNEMFDKYNAGELSVETIMEHIMRTYEELPVPNIPDIDSWMSSADFIDQITLRLLNGPENMDMIEQKHLVYHAIPNTELVCTFHAVMMSDGDFSGSVAVSKVALSQYLPDLESGEALYKEIIRRTKPESVRLESIVDVVERLGLNKTLDSPSLPADEDLFYVMSNPLMSYGAAALLTDAGRKLILEKFPEGKVTVLPSSVHETLILGTKADEDTDTLIDLVRHVNCTEVSQANFLSDHVFHFDANTGNLEQI